MTDKITEDDNIQDAINAINHAYESDFYFFEEYYDDKYGKERAVNLLAFRPHFKQILQALEEYPKLKEQNARNREDKEYWEKATKHEYQQFLKLKAEIEELKKQNTHFKNMLGMNR